MIMSNRRPNEYLDHSTHSHIHGARTQHAHSRNKLCALLAANSLIQLNILGYTSDVVALMKQTVEFRHVNTFIGCVRKSGQHRVIL